MKRLSEVPQELLDMLKKEQRRQSACPIASYEHVCSLPVRPARMRVLCGGEPKLVQTIVPATAIYATQHALLEEGYLDRNGLAYFVKGTGYAFPLAHVFHASGSICFGNIFVPSRVPVHSPQTPLETLFLHNDRVLGHGNATLKVSPDILADVRLVLDAYNIDPAVMDRYMRPNRELLAEDEIWNFAAYVYNTAGMHHGVAAMGKIYQCIFRGNEE